MFEAHGRKSPASEEMTGSRYRSQARAKEEEVTKSRGPLSCLKPSTFDEDNEPLTKSPEKKPIMSPSGKSISDIFGKVAQDKLKTKRRSVLPGELEEKSPEEEGEEVVKRTKNVCGLGGDVLAEMKVKQEKRASVIPK